MSRDSGHLWSRSIFFSKNSSVLTTKKHVLLNRALSTYHAMSLILHQNHLRLHRSPAPVSEWRREGSSRISPLEEKTKAFPSALTSSRRRWVGGRPLHGSRSDTGHGMGVAVSHVLPRTHHTWGRRARHCQTPACPPRPSGDGSGVTVLAPLCCWGRERGKRGRSPRAGRPAGSAVPSRGTGGRGAAPGCGWGSRTPPPKGVWKGRAARQMEMCDLKSSCDEAARSRPTLSLDARM